MKNEDLEEEYEEELEISHEQRFDRSIKRSLIVAVSAFLVVYGVYLVYFMFNDQYIVPEAAVWGQFGDFIGGVLNPIVAGLAFYWLVRSLKLQKEELADTRDVLNRSARHQRQQSLLIRKQNEIAGLQLSADIELAELEALQNERAGLLNRIIEGNSNINHAFYKSDAGGHPKLIVVVHEIDEKINIKRSVLSWIVTEIKGINRISNMQKMMENFEASMGVN